MPAADTGKPSVVSPGSTQEPKTSHGARALELLGVGTRTERPTLVLQEVRKGPLSLSPKAGARKSMVMIISPDGVNKRML